MNYNHLYYFWTVARLGAVTKASVELRLSQPTISEQIGKLEESLGEKLFERVGRGLRLTEAGQTALAYADQIFGLGRQMAESVHGSSPAISPRLVVGISHSISKLVAFRMIAPALKSIKSLRLVCLEDSTAALLALLALDKVDVVLSDAPLPRNVTRAFPHLLGRCGVSIVGAASTRRKARFPQCLDGAPFLMPEESAPLHQSLRNWFAAKGVCPVVVGEFSDSALLKLFGENGAGLFAVPAIVEREVKEKYGASAVGRITGITQEFYAITKERRITHPAVAAISQAAQKVMTRRG